VDSGYFAEKISYDTIKGFISDSSVDIFLTISKATDVVRPLSY
jgi:hypothetical protein